MFYLIANYIQGKINQPSFGRDVIENFGGKIKSHQLFPPSILHDLHIRDKCY